jgi:hypothetical protein
MGYCGRTRCRRQRTWSSGACRFSSSRQRPSTPESTSPTWCPAAPREATTRRAAAPGRSRNTDRAGGTYTATDLAARPRTISGSRVRCGMVDSELLVVAARRGSPSLQLTKPSHHDPEVEGGTMTCHCLGVSEMDGDDARRYASRHLVQVEARANGWEMLYRCPATGRTWLMDYPRSAEQGGGPARLRQIAKA